MVLICAVVSTNTVLMLTALALTVCVAVPPRWVVEPEDSFVVLHQTVQLDCQTAGTPEPTIQWKKAEGVFVSVSVSVCLSLLSLIHISEPTRR